MPGMARDQGICMPDQACGKAVENALKAWSCHAGQAFLSPYAHQAFAGYMRSTHRRGRFHAGAARAGR